VWGGARGVSPPDREGVWVGAVPLSRNVFTFSCWNGAFCGILAVNFIVLLYEQNSKKYIKIKAEGDFWYLGAGMAPLPPLNLPMT